MCGAPFGQAAKRFLGPVNTALVVSPGKRYHFQNAAESYHKSDTGYEISLTDIPRHVAKRMRDLERN